MSEGITPRNTTKTEHPNNRVVPKKKSLEDFQENASATPVQVEALLASTSAHRQFEAYSTLVEKSVLSFKTNCSHTEQVKSLAQIFHSLFEGLHKRTQSKSSNINEQEVILQTLKHSLRVISQATFCATFICQSLDLALAETKGDKSLTLQHLVESLIWKKNKVHFEFLSKSEVVTLVTAICIWSNSNHYDLFDFGTNILIETLQQILSQVSSEISLELTSSTLQTLSYLITSIQTKNTRIEKLGFEVMRGIRNMSTGEAKDNLRNAASGMATRLSLAGPDVGSGVTNFLADHGPSCTQNVKSLRDTLLEVSRTLSTLDGRHNDNVLNEDIMARLIHFFSDCGSQSALPDGRISGNHANWNLNVVSEVISTDYSYLDWKLVSQRFDFPGFRIRDKQHFESFLALYHAGAQKQLPHLEILGKWQNQGGQLSFIENLLDVVPSVYSVALDESESHDAATSIINSPSACNNPQAWASADLLQCLLHLSDVPSLAKSVRDLFVKGLLTCPEVLLCALVRLQLYVAQKGNIENVNVGMQMKGELMRELIPMFFKPNPHHRVQNGPAALRRLWSISPNTVTAACIEAWRSTSNDTPQARLATVVHVISIIRLLPSPETATATILSGNKDYEFSIAVAFVMSDNDMLQLRPWINERISLSDGTNSTGLNVGIMFLLGLIGYLGKTYSSAKPRITNANDGKNTPLVSLENLAICIQVFNNLDKKILAQEIPHVISTSNYNIPDGMTIQESLKAVVDSCVEAHPSINTASTSGSQTNDDIEEMANSYFQKIYTSEQNIGEVISMLKKFKTSGNPRENDIFACMIHNLFDEYRFFSKYPDRELQITGIFFGMLIQHQLVSSITLGIALRYVLEALRKPPSPNGTTSSSGKMFRFGMFALEQFKERLHEWPQYCSHIVQIPHLKRGYADLVGEIEAATSISDGQVKSIMGGSSGGSGAGVDGNSIFSDKSGNAAVDDQTPIGSGVPSSVDIRVKSPSIGNITPKELSTNLGQNPAINSLHMTNTVMTPRLQKEVNINMPIRKVAIFGPGLGRAVTDHIEGADVQHEAPPDTILDRVQFLINNVTMSNVDGKAQDLKDMLASQYFGWLGHYLVVKRISTQPNFHSVYLAFLDQLGDYGKGLVEAILSSVYLNVGKLLRSPKITTSTSERSLLKNLGSWLGQITLARNRPILQITLDCKELLFQGYETGMLIAVTPFVAKILEGAKNSIVFRPPNPWLMGLLSVFRALYGVDDLKMNIKFEVEVLCKNLGVKLEEISLCTETLAKRLPPVKTRNPDFNTKSSMGGNTNVSNTGQTPMSSQSASAPSTPSKISTPDRKQGSQDLAPAAASGMAMAATAGSANGPFSSIGASSSDTSAQDQQQTVIPNLAAYVTINPNFVSGNITHALLKRTVPIAVDRAIREIIQPVVERSVTIACITTKEIITKDFAMESDESKMRKAAQLMVANLAGSLALVTCREPLRASVVTHLRQLFMSNLTGAGGNSPENVQLNDQEQSTIENCVEECANDNLELGCMLIEKAATEKAIRDMDEALSPALTMRKKHREQTGQPFYDMSIFGNGSQRYPSALPEPLRPKPSGLRNEQLLVYEAFQRMPRQPTVPPSQVQPGSSSSSQAGNGGTNSAFSTTSSKSTSAKVDVEALSTIAGKLDNAVTSLLNAAGSRSSDITLSRLPSDHEVKQLLHAAQQMVTSTNSDGSLISTETDAVLGFSQGIFKRLYELHLTEPLRLESFVALLEALSQCCRQLGQDLSTWATYAPTETEGQRDLHRTILLLLMRSHLLDVAKLDEYLEKSMENGRNSIWVQFTLLFVRTAVIEKIFNPTELPKAIAILSRISEKSGENNQISHILRLVEDMNSSSLSNEPKGRSTPDNVAATVSGLNALVGKPDKPTHEQSSSISAASLSNLADATKRASEAILAISRDDPSGLKQQVMLLLDGWMRINSENNGTGKALQFMQLLQQHGVGKNEEQTERFFRISTEILVEAVLKSSNGEESKSPKEQRTLSYNVIDSYSKLIHLLITHMNSGGSSEQVANERISLLNQILGITVRTMMAHYQRAKMEDGGMIQNWDQRPWFRLFLNFLIDLNSPSPVLDPISFGILNVFGTAFHVLQPLVVPGRQ